jgi:putative DNA methylase
MTYKKKLIEVALPLEDINREAAREKSIRHGHPSTLHLWWARRPLAACRAVLFSSLVDDPSECVAELMADSAKRRAAEKALAAQRKLWEARKTLFDKAQTAGISAPEPGPEPKLEDILVETERERLFDIIRELVKWENSNDDRTLNKARAEIMRSCNGKPPPAYDPFCGGGSIPLEAQRLGLEAHASDLNPVPVLINKALIEIPPRFAGKSPVNPESRKKLSASGSWKGAAGLAEDIRYYGQSMRGEAEKRIGHLYPKVKLPKEHGGGEATVIAWLWARTVASPNPAAKGAHVPLVRSFWLSTRAGKKAWIETVVDQSTMTYRFEARTGMGEPRGSTVSRNGAVCLLTGSPMPLEYIRTEGKAGRLRARLIAIVAEGRGGRIYLSPSEEHERIALSAQPHDVPETDLPEQALGFRIQNYGLTKHRHLFTNRQLVTLTMLSDLVSEARSKILEDAGNGGISTDQAQAHTDAVVTYLGFGVSKLADYNSSLALWSPTRDQAKATFSRHALPIAWDFAEVNSFAEAAGDLTVSLRGIAETVERCVAGGQAYCKQCNAENIVGSGFLFSTDPPYYDNVPYADLSDFFYVWLRRSLSATYPELLGTLLVPKTEELVADPFRHGGKSEARSFFERGMGRVLEKMRNACDPRFPATIFYAFKQAEDDEADEDDEIAGDVTDLPSRASTGWETFLQGLADAGWQIDGTWPMRTERGVRTRSLGSNALASSIVLVCRPRPKDAGVASRRDFLAALKRELPEALRNLQKGNIAPVDLAQAAIGPGMAVFSRYARVLETDGSPMGVRTALSLINQSLDEVLAEQEGEFDADTRWALAWFDQYGFTEGAYGQAETLSTAKNTSVSGMVEAGILAAKGGKVRLLKKEELPADWDPVDDARLTIWESTHHLIRALDQGEQAAAELLRKLGAVAEIARDLSYRLYTVCERRKWSQDAIGYNALVLAWPDLTRLAQEQKTAGPSQGELI